MRPKLIFASGGPHKKVKLDRCGDFFKSLVAYVGAVSNSWDFLPGLAHTKYMLLLFGSSAALLMFVQSCANRP